MDICESDVEIPDLCVEISEGFVDILSSFPEMGYIKFWLTIIRQVEKGEKPLLFREKRGYRIRQRVGKNVYNRQKCG